VHYATPVKRLLIGSLLATACAAPARPMPATTLPNKHMLVIHGFESGLAGVHAANANVKLSVERDPSLSESVLIVDYPAPSDDPAARDVCCDAQNRDWTAGRAIALRIKPATALKLSVSFFDRNHVAYTTWADLKAGEWQPVRIELDAIRPNPYFQRADAKTGAPLDISEVSGIAFAPHDQLPGRLSISQLVVVE
jgi:hypothetical protein